MTRLSIGFRIEKASPSGRFVSGWFSVTDVDGQPYSDTDGDSISMDTLRKAFHGFIKKSRAVKAQHRGEPIGECVEIVMIDDDFAAAHGITHGKRGAWGTMEITDEATREDVRKGRFKGFSVGGRGRKIPIAKSQPDGSGVHVRRPLSLPRKQKIMLARARRALGPMLRI